MRKIDLNSNSPFYYRRWPSNVIHLKSRRLMGQRKYIYIRTSVSRFVIIHYCGILLYPIRDMRQAVYLPLLYTDDGGASSDGGADEAGSAARIDKGAQKDKRVASEADEFLQRYVCWTGTETWTLADSTAYGDEQLWSHG